MRSLRQRWSNLNAQRRIMPGLSPVALLILLILTGCVASPEQTGEDAAIEEANPDRATLDSIAQKNIGLTIETATLKPVLQTIRATAVVGPDETRVAHLRPLARGRIERVYVRLGTRVQAGQPLLVYDNIELGELIGEYRTAFAESEVARRSLERAGQLLALGAMAQAEYERRGAEAQRTQALIRTLTEKLRRFGVSETEIAAFLTDEASSSGMSSNTLRAPLSGTVIRLDIAPGETMDSTDDLLTIANLSTVWVQADLYERDMGLVHVDQEIRMTTEAYSDVVFIGRITYISDVLDPGSRTARVRCEIPNPDGRLKLNMFAMVHIPVSRGREAVMIPSEAVQRIDNQPVVFVPIDGTRFQRRDVQLGVESDGWIEVTAGLPAGTRVVAKGSFSIKSRLLSGLIGEEE